MMSIEGTVIELREALGNYRHGNKIQLVLGDVVIGSERKEYSFYALCGKDIDIKSGVRIEAIALVFANRAAIHSHIILASDTYPLPVEISQQEHLVRYIEENKGISLEYLQDNFLSYNRSLMRHFRKILEHQLEKYYSPGHIDLLLAKYMEDCEHFSPRKDTIPYTHIYEYALIAGILNAENLIMQFPRVDWKSFLIGCYRKHRYLLPYIDEK